MGTPAFGGTSRRDMLIFCFTEAGHARRNEDAIATLEHPSASDVLIVGLADGQGGQPGGAQAAAIASSVAVDAASDCAVHDLLIPTSWVNICHAADAAVATARDAGRSTLVALCATSEWVVGGSAGDSAAVIVFDDAAAVLTERQRKNPPVGTGCAVFEPFSARLDGNWQLIVLSDGAWKYAGWETIIRLGREHRGPRLISALRDAAVHRRGGELPDDFSVVVLGP